jgi:cytochrome c
MPGCKPAIALSAAVLLAANLSAQQATGPGLGRAATPEEIKALDLSIPPDGTGLPAGQGTARAGEDIYVRRCASCHGEKGEGKTNDRLVGGFNTLTGKEPPVKTIGSYWQWATTLFDYTRRAMPYGAPLSLTDDEAYAVTAYLLFLNGIIAQDEVMDAKTLPRVKMPNRDNFVNAYPNRPK